MCLNQGLFSRPSHPFHFNLSCQCNKKPIAFRLQGSTIEMDILIFLRLFAKYSRASFVKVTSWCQRKIFRVDWNASLRVHLKPTTNLFRFNHSFHFYFESSSSTMELPSTLYLILGVVATGIFIFFVRMYQNWPRDWDKKSSLMN